MLAERLVSALQRENVRWAESMTQLREHKATLPGDMLLTAAFIAYCMSLVSLYFDPQFNRRSLQPSLPKGTGVQALVT